MVSHKHTMVDT